MRGFGRGLAITAALAFIGPATALRAQDVEYTSTTKTEMPGALGTIASIGAKLGGGSMDTEGKTYVKGTLMRMDDGEKTSTIFDYANGTFIYLDHEAKTYAKSSLEEMAAMMERAGQQMKEAKAQAQAERQAAPSGGAQGDQGEVKLKYDMKIEPTHEHRKINGYDAERVLMTLTTDASARPENEKDMQHVGALVVVEDMWVSKDNPAYQAMERLKGSGVLKDMQRRSSAMASVFGGMLGNPDAGEALKKAAEEAQKVEGMPIRTVVALVTVPDGVKLDADAALAPDKDEEKSDKGLSAKSVAGGMLKGMFGGGKKEEPEEQKEEKPQQFTLMRIITDVKDIRSTSLPASLFEPPAGYREVKLPTGPGTN